MLIKCTDDIKAGSHGYYWMVAFVNLTVWSMCRNWEIERNYVNSGRLQPKLNQSKKKKYVAMLADCIL